MGSLVCQLELEDGTPAPMLRTAVPTWHADHTIPLGGRALRVVAVKDDESRSSTGAGRERHVRAGH
jgi:hypothetical protein